MVLLVKMVDVEEEEVDFVGVEEEEDLEDVAEEVDSVVVEEEEVQTDIGKGRIC